jgi:CRISPR/Cas system-associated protein Cas10 (large subunit of type III CRISPR-Cas system)
MFQPVNEIAQIDEAIDADEEDAETYYAVIAMDGDDMGQWVGGAKTAPLVNSLAEQAQTYFRDHWGKGATDLPPANEVPRPLSPGYHAALSEALANFSLYCAGPIIEAFKGQLIYAGGDDVLAMTPAHAALDCAQALQLAFRGIHPDASDAHASNKVREVLKDLFDYSQHTDGFLTLRKSERGDVGRAEHLKPNWPLLVMGPKASVSAGIAIGHVRAPMQDTIQAARDAEKSAKKVKNKGAFCLRILKRSGEAVGFAARWDDGAAAVWGELNAQIHDLSGRFAYRYAELVKTLVVEGGGVNSMGASEVEAKRGNAVVSEDGGEAGVRYADIWHDSLAEAVQAELRHVLRQQGGLPSDKAREIARQWCGTLIPSLCPRDFLHFWLSWAFVNRHAKPNATNLS